MERDYIISVPTLNIKIRNQHKGAGMKEIFKRVSVELNQKLLINSVPEIDFKGNYHGELQQKMFYLNDFLNKFGFFINGDYFTKSDFFELELIRNEYKALYSPTKEQIQMVNEKISKILLQQILLPDNRAMIMTALIMPTNHLKKYGHLIEQAFISLMRGEYISVIMILTPVVEGVLRSLDNFDFKGKKFDDINKLINNFCTLEYNYDNPSMTHPYMLDEYIRCFVNIFNNIFFNAHQTAEENLFFNRHYISHLMGDGTFYTRDNAIKLVMLIDLLGFIISSHTGQNNIFEKSRDDLDYKLRFEYYLLQAKQFNDQFLRTNIMKQHENFRFTTY